MAIDSDSKCWPNAGPRMLQEVKSIPREKQKNLQSIGTIMMEIMEPATFLANPMSTELVHPARWNDSLEMENFLRSTVTSSWVELEGVSWSKGLRRHVEADSRQHKSLGDVASSKCLVPHVLMAQVSARMDWQIFTALGKENFEGWD